MKISILLLEKKTTILQKWFDSVISSYPESDLGFFKSKHNPFASSIVGQTIKESLEGIFHAITDQKDAENVSTYLDNIIRVRAIQELNPSDAVSFIFDLKQIIREELKESIRELEMFRELHEIESRIDALASLSFDIFMRCREKLFELKANEMRNWTYRVVKKSQMYKEVKAEE